MANEIEGLKRRDIHRKLQYGTVHGPNIIINSKTLLNLCSNDYLGMPVTQLDTTQLQSSSRLISGNDDSYRMLEKNIARHRSTESSLTYPTGYMANMGVIPVLGGKGDSILSDELNHASIIDACRLSDAKTTIYSHNDMDDLATKLRQNATRKIIITEGVFSMDGDYAELRQITELAQRYDAIVIVDDAHGDFVEGSCGKGTPHMMRVSKKTDIHISSLSKGLGSFGGYVASSRDVIELLVNRSRPFIYTSGLPAFIAEHAIKRLGADRERYRKKLHRNTREFSSGLKNIGCDINSESHIIPIMVGSEKKALKIGKFLQDSGLFVQPIRYPTVPANSARLRVSVTAWLSRDDIQRAITIFEKAVKKFKI